MDDLELASDNLGFVAICGGFWFCGTGHFRSKKDHRSSGQRRYRLPAVAEEQKGHDLTRLVVTGTMEFYDFPHTIYICIYNYIYMCVSICIYVFIYIYIYIYICICICMYIYMESSSQLNHHPEYIWNNNPN